MSNVLFITPGPIKWASSRLRAHWIAEGIEGAEVMTNDKRWLSKGWGAVIFVKVIAETMIVEALQGQGTKAIWDICDPVHWLNPEDARQMADAVDTIIASNPALAQDFSEWYLDKPVHVIPDRIKLDHYPTQRKHQAARPVRFIWYGAGQNRFSLLGAFMNLERLRANGVNLSLTICDDQPQAVWQAEFPILHTAWEVDKENEILASHDIAILPPYPGAWGKVKSNNKYLTAWACGLPVTDGENYHNLYELATRVTQREIAAKEGMETLIKYYTIDKSVEQWKGLLAK